MQPAFSSEIISAEYESILFVMKIAVSGVRSRNNSFPRVSPILREKRMDLILPITHLSSSMSMVRPSFETWNCMRISRLPDLPEKSYHTYATISIDNAFLMMFVATVKDGRNGKHEYALDGSEMY